MAFFEQWWKAGVFKKISLEEKNPKYVFWKQQNTIKIGIFRDLGVHNIAQKGY